MNQEEKWQSPVKSDPYQITGAAHWGRRLLEHEERTVCFYTLDYRRQQNTLNNKLLSRIVWLCEVVIKNPAACDDTVIFKACVIGMCEIWQLPVH